MKNPRLEIVEWEDATGVTSEWEWVSELNGQKVGFARSVGIVLEESKKELVLASNWIDEMDGDAQVCGIMVIPKGTIVRREGLRSRNGNPRRGN